MNGNEQPLFLLDTNVVLYLIGNRLVDPLPVGQFSISIITEIELLSYSNLSLDEEEKIRSFLSQVTVAPIEILVKEQTIALRKQYRIKLPDAIIAATATALKAILLTNDGGLLNLPGVHAESVAIM